MQAGDRLDGSRISGSLIGREREVTLLQSSLDTARSGRSLITLMVGEPGIGKTRLVNEAAVMGRSAQMRVLSGQADRASREPMELWRAVHRTLKVEPFPDLTLSAEVRRWDYLENLAGALSACAPAWSSSRTCTGPTLRPSGCSKHLPQAVEGSPIAFVATSREHEPDMPPLEDLRRASRVIMLEGLDVEAVRQLALAETADSNGRPIDAVDLHARTGGNPLFVQEVVRSPHGSGVVSELLRGSFTRFDDRTLRVLAMTAVAGPGTPLGLIATATDLSSGDLVELLGPALREGVLDHVSPGGVRFRHALFAEAAARLGDTHPLDARLASVGRGGRPRRPGFGRRPRLRAARTPAEIADAVATTCDVAADLVAARRLPRAAGLLAEAEQAATTAAPPP